MSNAPEPSPGRSSGFKGSPKANGTTPPEPPPPSIFDDLDRLRLDDAASLTATSEVLSHVPVRRPLKTEFVRVSRDPAMLLVASVFEDREERETFFVTPEARCHLVGQLRPVLLTTAISRQGVMFLWPLPLPEDGGRTSAWSETARQAAELAKSDWINLRPDMHLGSYRIKKAEGELPEPAWPETPFNELLKIGFRGKIIDSADHPVVRRLRGLV